MNKYSLALIFSLAFAVPQTFFAQDEQEEIKSPTAEENLDSIIELTVKNAVADAIIEKIKPKPWINRELTFENEIITITVGNADYEIMYTLDYTYKRKDTSIATGKIKIKEAWGCNAAQEIPFTIETYENIITKGKLEAKFVEAAQNGIKQILKQKNLKTKQEKWAKFVAQEEQKRKEEKAKKARALQLSQNESQKNKNSASNSDTHPSTSGNHIMNEEEGKNNPSQSKKTKKTKDKNLLNKGLDGLKDGLKCVCTIAAKFFNTKQKLKTAEESFETYGKTLQEEWQE